MMADELQDRLAYAGKLLHETARLPVALIAPGGSIQQEWGTVIREDRFRSSTADALFEIVRSVGEAPLPVIHDTNYLEHVLTLTAEAGPAGVWTLAVGPVLYARPSPETFRALMEDNRIPAKERERWSDYYRALPEATKMQLVHAGMLLHLLVKGETLQPQDLLGHVHRLERRLVREEEVGRELAWQRENAVPHHDPYMEVRLYDCIRNGDKAGALQMMAAFREDSYGILSRSSHLRNRKNLAIVTVTLATRAAMDAGMFWMLAYTLSDLHIQHIEDLQEVRQVDHARIDALADFADRVRQLREQKVSRTIAACQNYIYNHLYEEITLENLARLTGLNGQYLSQRFKKELGVSFRDYLAERRIEEARSLIKHARRPLSEIASRLCFHDQSHFTKAFKKRTGMTPQQYRLETSASASPGGS